MSSINSLTEQQLSDDNASLACGSKKQLTIAE
jgi:hypothetical protein